MWLTREQFRNGVFERDNNQCVICGGDTSLDAHHILERRLFGKTQGYCLSNGATLCSKHHIQAEQTVLSCDEIREKAGITEIILPDYLYEEYSYSKWGDILLPNGTRLRGELFYDDSVQKILKSGQVLDLYSKYVKYPRTYHLPFSGKTTKDDRILENTNHFEGKEVIVSIKKDGENNSLYRDYMHARSINSNSHPSQSFVKNLHNMIAHDIPEGWRICGENLYAKHTIYYENLKAYFYIFSIWNEKNECLSWDETVEWSDLLGIPTVEVIYRGMWNYKDIEDLTKIKEYNGDKVEGFVVRLSDCFSYGNFRLSVAKYVSEEFRTEIKYEYSWRYKPFTINKIMKKFNE